MRREYFMSCLLFWGFFCSSCYFTSQRHNSYGDKKDGEKTVGTYFSNMILEKEELNKILFSKEFLNETNFETFLKNQQYIEQKLGKMLGKELESWETSVVSGTQSKSEYLFVFKVEREKHNSKETFYLIKDKNDSIKIRNYKLESEGLLKPDE